jgi:hypothetical protein
MDHPRKDCTDYFMGFMISDEKGDPKGLLWGRVKIP